ncbi:MAG TPA: hypothetical protein VJZ25_07145 [Gemmatimonadaceae bacterium]|nr:hypothetical protein [Gemmatimonadaceae bacterium]
MTPAELSRAVIERVARQRFNRAEVIEDAEAIVALIAQNLPSVVELLDARLLPDWSNDPQVKDARAEVVKMIQRYRLHPSEWGVVKETLDTFAALVAHVAGRQP